MAENFANTYQTTINDSGGISAGDTSVIVTSVTGAPVANFRIKIDDELILVTAIASLTFTIERGIEGTTAATHADGATVTHVLTAEVASSMVQITQGAGPIVIPGFAGHGGIAGVGGGGIDEEYDTSTTGLTWNVSPSGGIDSNTTIPNALTGSHVFGGAGSIYGLRAWAPGSVNLEASAQVATAFNDSASTFAFGIMIAASGGTPTNAVAVSLNQSRSTQNVNAASLAGSTWTQRGSSWTVMGPVYVRITRAASSDVWNMYWSSDGRIWNLIVQHTLAITIAQVGYRWACSAAVGGFISSDFLRTTV